ncbi:hypothetical protein [Microbacterium sulfonylureivorans]|uniref:hypothetical protein n=1 Tax=Microbacterium sulfonylureivorans TaxID=2486854 RepID=UPI0013E0630D|nr:hypothetical protein [Microbacterium sulfonylureivorans]
MNEADHRTRRPGRGLRRVIVAIAIVSFAIAAISGIVVLLGADIGDTGWRVLASTAIIGAFSIAVLCCASLIGRRLQAFGVAGAVIAILAAGLSVWFVWYRGPSDDAAWWEPLLKVLMTLIAASVAFALASLLLLLADRRRPAVRISLTITLALFAVVLGLIVYNIWRPAEIDYEVYQRWIGITSILAALGAVVVPVISIFLRDSDAAVTLSPIAVARLEEEAARRGLAPDALVDVLLAEASPAGPPIADPEPAGTEP